MLVSCGQDQDWNEMGGREIFHYVIFYSFNFCTSSKIFFNFSFLFPPSLFQYLLQVVGGTWDQSWKSS